MYIVYLEKMKNPFKTYIGLSNPCIVQTTMGTFDSVEDLIKYSETLDLTHESKYRKHMYQKFDTDTVSYPYNGESLPKLLNTFFIKT